MCRVPEHSGKGLRVISRYLPRTSCVLSSPTGGEGSGYHWEWGALRTLTGCTNGAASIRFPYNNWFRTEYLLSSRRRIFTVEETGESWRWAQGQGHAWAPHSFPSPCPALQPLCISPELHPSNTSFPLGRKIKWGGFEQHLFRSSERAHEQVQVNLVAGGALKPRQKLRDCDTPNTGKIQATSHNALERIYFPVFIWWLQKAAWKSFPFSEPHL